MYKLEPNTDDGISPELTDDIKKAFQTAITRAYIKVVSTGQIINEENYLKDLTISELRYVPDRGIFGGTVAKKVEINFNNVENSFTIQDEEIEVHIGVEYNNEVYYINYGNFIVQHPDNENVTDNTHFEALDYMIKLNTKFKDRLTYPCTLRDVAKDICDQAGIELGDENFRNADFIVTDNQFVSGESNRVVASAIAYSAFSWARIGNDNKLYFDFKVKEIYDEQITYDNYYNLNFDNKEYGPINRIILRNSQIDGENVTIDDEESIKKFGIHELVIEDNPFAYTQEKREELIKAGQEIFGFHYTPINDVNLTGYLYLNCQDAIQFIDMQERSMLGYVFDHIITYNGVSLDEIKSPAMTETETKYIYKPELTEAYKNTQIIVNKHDQTIIGLIQKTDETNDRLTQFYQDLQKFQFSVSSSGGNNLIKNSVGWADLDFWETDNKQNNIEMEQGSFNTTTNEPLTSTTRLRPKEKIKLSKGKYKLSVVGDDNLKIVYNLSSSNDINTVVYQDTWKSADETIITINETRYLNFAIAFNNDTTITLDNIDNVNISEVIDITTNKSDEIVKNSLSKSAFQLNNGTMKQSFEVEVGKNYSVGFKIKKPLIGTGYVKIIGDTLLKEFDFETNKAIDYESYEFTFLTRTQVITVEIYSDCGMIITDLIANTGDILSQWQPYAQELYALGVQIDSNGVKTYDNISGQEVLLRPTGLVGKYEDEEVFKLNKDITETKKLSAREEIDMHPIKIVGRTDGWDFVYID